MEHLDDRQRRAMRAEIVTLLLFCDTLPPMEMDFVITQGLLRISQSYFKTQSGRSTFIAAVLQLFLIVSRSVPMRLHFQAYHCAVNTMHDVATLHNMRGLIGFGPNLVPLFRSVC